MNSKNDEKKALEEPVTLEFEPKLSDLELDEAQSQEIKAGEQLIAARLERLRGTE